MPAHVTQGTLPAIDLLEYDDTGVVVLETSFTPRQVIKEKTGHIAEVVGEGATPACYQQILQVQIHNQALDIDQKMEVVPTAAGARTGLANLASGAFLYLANFAANAEIHGYTRTTSKLLMVREPKSAITADKSPTTEFTSTYYPQIVNSDD
jgi:hypothetical protein